MLQFTALTQNDKAPLLTKTVQPVFALPEYPCTDKDGYTYAIMLGENDLRTDAMAWMNTVRLISVILMCY